MNGWISLHRDLFDWEWYKDSKVLHLWIHLLLIANHEDGYVSGILVKRGQRITSLPKLSEETGLSIQEVRTALKKLVSTGNITDTSTNKYRLITVEKYDDWQKLSTGSNRQVNRQVNSQATANNKNNKLNKDDDARARQKNPVKISDVLSDQDWSNLDARYEDIDRLIDMVDELTIDVSDIRKPYNYICSIADREHWSRKHRLTSWIRSI